MVPRWRFLATFLRPVFSACRLQQVSDLHLQNPNVSTKNVQSSRKPETKAMHRRRFNTSRIILYTASMSSNSTISKAAACGRLYRAKFHLDWCKPEKSTAEQKQYRQNCSQSCEQFAFDSLQMHRCYLHLHLRLQSVVCTRRQYCCIY